MACNTEEMPIRRDTPRPSFRRTDLKVLEKYKLALASHGLNDSVRILLLLALWFKKQERTRDQILAMQCASFCMQMLFNRNNKNLFTLT